MSDKPSGRRKFESWITEPSLLDEILSRAATPRALPRDPLDIAGAQLRELLRRMGVPLQRALEAQRQTTEEERARAARLEASAEEERARADRLETDAQKQREARVRGGKNSGRERVDMLDNKVKAIWDRLPTKRQKPFSENTWTTIAEELAKQGHSVAPTTVRDSLKRLQSRGATLADGELATRPVVGTPIVVTCSHQPTWRCDHEHQIR